MTTDTRQNVYTRVTDSIIAAIEAGAGKWKTPWHGQGNFARPVNVASGNPYRGINTVALWVAAYVTGYASPIWGTYKQWHEKGAQVRKGEKASTVVFWKVVDPAAHEADSQNEDSDQPHAHMFARAYCVFNAQQVEGWEAPAMPALPQAERIEHAERFFGSLGATIKEEGFRPSYIPSLDEIRMPPFAIFPDAETYYVTLAHEVTHWSGHPSRCARDLKGRFGDARYAAEELIAELGAAFLCSDLAISSQPHPDHAAYIADWLNMMRADPRAIFTAAAKAQAAADWMHARQPQAMAA